MDCRVADTPLRSVCCLVCNYCNWEFLASKMAVWILFWLATLLLYSANAACTFSGGSDNCQSLGLTSVPTGIPNTTTILYVFNVCLTVIRWAHVTLPRVIKP